MKYPNMNKTLIAVAASFALQAPAMAADLDAGKKIVQTVCKTCHGLSGNGNPENADAATSPRLAGQYADYMEKALADYANGKRKNPIMRGFASMLSPADRRNVAAYFMAQEGGVVTIEVSK
jgi:cytochrome c553